MRGLLGRWIVSAIALYITVLLSQILEKKYGIGIGINMPHLWTSLLVVVILAVINSILRPIMIALTLPLNCLTMGTFTLVINALLFWLVGMIRPQDFEVKTFWAALFGSVVMGIISGLGHHLLSKKK